MRKAEERELKEEEEEEECQEKIGHILCIYIYYAIGSEKRNETSGDPNQDWVFTNQHGGYE